MASDVHQALDAVLAPVRADPWNRAVAVGGAVGGSAIAAALSVSFDGLGAGGLLLPMASAVLLWAALFLAIVSMRRPLWEDVAAATGTHLVLGFLVPAVAFGRILWFTHNDLGPVGNAFVLVAWPAVGWSRILYALAGL